MKKFVTTFLTLHLTIIVDIVLKKLYYNVIECKISSEL